MRTRDALYRSILASPHDDTIRLAYADCVEEEGDEELAGLIRGQINGDIGPVTFGPEWRGPSALWHYGLYVTKYTNIKKYINFIRSSKRQVPWRRVGNLGVGLRHAWLTSRRGFLDHVEINWYQDW